MKPFQAKTSLFLTRKEALAVKKIIQKGGWVSQQGAIDKKLDVATYVIGIWHPDLITVVEKVTGELKWEYRVFGESN